MAGSLNPRSLLGSRNSRGSALPSIPAGFAFLVDADGAYLVDSDGAYLITVA